jgi:ATP-binding cassette subfamily A (ABC1) protein 3
VQSLLFYQNRNSDSIIRLAYLVFDGIIVLVVSVFITAVFGVAVPAAWWNLTFIWLCLFLYGLASILLSYVISLIAKSQLSAFAFSAGGQAYVSHPTLYTKYSR